MNTHVSMKRKIISPTFVANNSVFLACSFFKVKLFGFISRTKKLCSEIYFLCIFRGLSVDKIKGGYII